MFSDQFNKEEDKLAFLLKAARFISQMKAGVLTASEQQDLDNWLQEDPKHQLWLDDLLTESYWSTEKEQYALSAQAAPEAWLEIQSRMNAEEHPDTAAIYPSLQPATRSLYKWGWAAAIIILFGTGIYLFMNSGQANKFTTNSRHLSDATQVFPASNKAILTLQNGEQVQLDSTTNVLLSEKGIRKGKQLLSYEGVVRAAETNTLTTPRGVQYQLVLSDGTKVWLNAESSITYPSSFNGGTRQVKATGEVYFEVAPDKTKPFFVTVEHQEIQVLGTSFNMNAYANEAIINTTLLDGAIKVSYLPEISKNAAKAIGKGKSAQDEWSVILAPGQQAQLLKSWSEAITTPPIKVNKHFNKDHILAWKNGLFNFEGADIYEVMRQLERWYNIKVAYEGKLKTEEFQGKMYRNVSLAVVLEMLEKMGYKWKVNGDVYTIMN